MKKEEASYTVELSLLLPILLFALFAPIYMGYEMCSQTEKASVCGWNEEFCAEEKVRNLKFAESVLEKFK